MNGAIKSFLAARVGRPAGILVQGTMFVGKVVVVDDDGVVVEATDGRQFCFAGSLVLFACDPVDTTTLDKDTPGKVTH